jgi:hypothetical protein
MVGKPITMPVLMDEARKERRDSVVFSMNLRIFLVKIAQKCVLY